MHSSRYVFVVFPDTILVAWPGNSTLYDRRNDNNTNLGDTMAWIMQRIIAALQLPSTAGTDGPRRIFQVKSCDASKPCNSELETMNRRQLATHPSNRIADGRYSVVAAQPRSEVILPSHVLRSARRILWTSGFIWDIDAGPVMARVLSKATRLCHDHPGSRFYCFTWF